MTRWLMAGLLATQVASAAPAAPALSPLHQAQAEAHLAKVRVLQLEIQLRQQALSAERTALEQAIAAAHPGWRMDWNAGQLVPVATEGQP
jgi:hypothetical protein